MTTPTNTNGTGTAGYEGFPHESTFAAGASLLEPGLRRDVHRLYHVLRLLDDLVDADDPRADEHIEAVERWARHQPAATPEVAVLDELHKQSGLSREPLLEFCAGMRHDIARTPIDTEADLERYCQRVGGAVGVMLAQIFGTSSPEGQTRMATLGRATQRTNILRDIDEDASQRRIYIARSTIERFGEPAPGKRSELLRDQIARADALYEEGLKAIPLMRSGQRWIAMTAALYREILRQIEREGYGRQAGRTRVPGWRQRLIVTRHHLPLPRPPHTRLSA